MSRYEFQYWYDEINTNVDRYFYLVFYFQVSQNNITEIHPHTGYLNNVVYHYDLFGSLQVAGTSFGIVTEFHYRIFHGPEVLPANVLVYIEDKSDLWKFEAAVNNGRYHLCLHTPFYFTPPNWFDMETKVRYRKQTSPNWIFGRKQR